MADFITRLLGWGVTNRLESRRKFEIYVARLRKRFEMRDSMFRKADKDCPFDDVLDQIIAHIRSGELKPGDPLPTERAMADLLGISRPIVREVLKSLELLGIITCVHGGGNYIADHLESCLIRPISILFAMNNGSVQQSQQLRAALECQAAYLAAGKCSPLDAARLHLLMEQLAVSEKEEEMEQYDRELHLAIAQIADNPLIYSVLSASALLTDRMIADIRRVAARETQSVHEIDAQHRELVDAIVKKDAVRAECAMKIHMEAIAQYIVEWQKEQGQADR